MSTVFQNCELETSCPAIKESSWLNREKELRVFPQKERQHMVDFMVKNNRAIVNCNR